MFKKLIPILAFALLAPAAASTAPPSTAASPTAVESGTARILVGFEKGTGTRAQRALVARVGGKRLATVSKLRTAVISVPASDRKEAIAELERAPGVAYAEPDRVLSAAAVPVDDPYLNHTSWPLKNPAFPDAWGLTRGDPNMVVAVLDTGVQPDHPDLPPLTAGQDMVDPDTPPDDDEGHGTAVAGIIAAIPNNSIGVAGTCWRCQIMPVKVLDSTGYGYTSWIAEGIVWAVDQGASVLNLSLGGPMGTDTLADAVSYAQSQNVLVVAAAGNFTAAWTDPLPPPPNYPAGYPGVLSVGAIDGTNTYYSFSYFGPWVEVDAPGCTVSTALGSFFHGSDLYGSFCGTSAASPYVAGLAALARSYRPQLSAPVISEAIQKSATPLGDSGNSVHGAINALKTLQLLDIYPATPTASFNMSATSGNYPLTVKFENTSSGASSYSWSFGDGATSTEFSPTHVFARMGLYEVVLEVRNGSVTSTARSSVQVLAPPPDADFGASRLTGPAPLKVTFTNRSTRFTSSRWSFGDGTPYSIEASPTHLFAKPGKYAVTLNASGQGGTDTAQLVVTITESRPDLAVSLSRTASRLDRGKRLDSMVAKVRNQGHAKDENVRLKIMLPASSTLKKVKAGTGRCSVSGRRVTCLVGTLRAGRSVRVWVVARLASGSTTSATATGHRPERTSKNNKARIRAR